MPEPAPERHGIRLDRLLQIIVAGLISGFLAIVLCVGFATLLLPSDLRAYAPAMIGMTLFSTMMLNIIAAFLSPIRGGINVIQEVPIVVMATVSTTIVAAMAAEASDDAKLATIVAAFFVTTILSGAAFLALGNFRIGGLIRFVPYPVIGGFLAGTGWLIFYGGFSVVLGEPVTLGSLGAMVGSETITRFVAAAVVVAIVATLAARKNGTIAVPIAILIILALYNVAVGSLGFSAGDLRASGWLVPVPAEGRLWPPIALNDLAAIDWHAVLLSLVALPGLVLVSALALLMNATGIELDRGGDVDVDAELRSVGIQNLVTGVSGGVPGYPSVSLTLLITRLGAVSRGTPLVVAVLCGAALLFQSIVLGLVPTPLLGGLLLWIGGGLMVTWLVGAYRRLAFGEYAIVALILVVIATAGFTWGIFAGLAAAIALFVFEYSRTDVVHTQLRGDAYHSNSEASEARTAALREHGAAIMILRLQGYLFFGTADRLRRRVLADIAKKGDAKSTRFVLIDFRRVTGIDSSATSSFARLIQNAARDGFTLVIAGAASAVRAAVERASGALPSAVHFEPDVERGLFWSENALLAEMAPGARHSEPSDLTAVLSRLIGSESAPHVAAAFTRLTFSPGERLIEEGSPSDDLFIIEEGSATVAMQGRDGPTAIASVGAGAVIGEVAFYRGQTRTAGVVADEPTVAWRLTRSDLAALNATRPEVAAHFHHGLARALAERLARTDRLLAFLVD